MKKGSIPLRSRARTELAEVGVTGAAAEVFLDATSADRHEARVTSAMRAALDEWLRVTGCADWKKTNNVERIHAHHYAMAVLVLDAFGVVDPKRGPRDYTNKIHHRAFRNLGGARVGPAAGATFAARRAALDRIWSGLADKRGAPAQIILRPSVVEPIGLCVEVPPCGATLLCIEPNESLDAQSPSWLLTIVLEAMRRGMDAEPWFQLGDETPGDPRILELVHIDGSARDWGVVLSALMERLRIEGISTSIGTIATERGLPRITCAPARRVTLVDIATWLRIVMPDEKADELRQCVADQALDAQDVADAIRAARPTTQEAAP